ncbi:MAG: flagellar biosynthetic protein FliR [Moorellaceae bacterium]
MGLPYLERAEMFFLVFVRLTAFMAVAPFFAARNLPALVKAALGLLVAFLLFPTIPGPQTGETWAHPLGYALAVANEALAGLALGLIAQLIFSAVIVAGEFLDLHMGLGMANLLDPQNATPVTLLGQFWSLLGLLLFLQMDGHHVLLLALRESFRFLPLGKVEFKGLLVWEVVRLVGNMMLWSLRLAAPVIVVLLVADLSLSLISRTVPQLNVFILGFPLKIGLGLIIILAVLPLAVTAVSNLITQMESDLASILHSWMP